MLNNILNNFNDAYSLIKEYDNKLIDGFSYFLYENHNRQVILKRTLYNKNQFIGGVYVKYR